MTNIISPVGANVDSGADDTPKFALGTIALSDDGREWVYCQAPGTVGATVVSLPNLAVTITPAYAISQLSTSTDAYGNLVGIVEHAYTGNQYGWVQRKGPADIYVGASCAANARLNTTATGGMLDDDGTTGAMEVRNIALTTARGGSNGAAAGVLNYPVVGSTL